MYNTKYILKYCNAQGDALKIELQLKDYLGEAFLLVDDDTYVTNEDGKYVVMNIDGKYIEDRDSNPIEGAANPFSLTYRNDLGEKGGTIRATEANMSFFEDLLFNIDDLATNDEVGIRCVFSLNGDVEWIGFVVPDFFNVEIAQDPIIDLTASDRIGILKDLDYNVDLANLSTLRSDLYLVNKILKDTGLELNINILCDFQCQEIANPLGSILNNVFVSENRFIKEGKVGNCYDVLKSVLDKYNCLFTQYKGEWWVFNKEQLEIGQGTIYKYSPTMELLSTLPFVQDEYSFSLIDSNSQRTIMPAGGKNTYRLDIDSYPQYPFNGDMKYMNSTEDLAYWSKRFAGGIISYMTKRVPIEYNSAGEVIDYYDAENRYLGVWDNIGGEGMTIGQWIYQSHWFNIPSLSSKKMDFDLSILGVGKPETSLSVILIIEFDHPFYKYAWSNVDNGGPVYFHFGRYLDDPGPYNTINDLIIRHGNALPLQFADKYKNINLAVEQEFKFSVSAADGQDQNFDLTKAKMCVRVYPNRAYYLSPNAQKLQNVIKHIKIDFKRDDQDPKGVIYQSLLLNKFTKSTELRKVMFGDFQDYGQNGYLYPYRVDSLSIHYNSAGEKLKKWRTNTDQSFEPLLIHSLRQYTKSYGKAHDELSIGFDMTRINPFAHYAIKCISEKYIQVEGNLLMSEDGSYITADVAKYLNNKKYVLVEGTIDYLRSHFTGKLSQVVTNSVDSQEFIYSDFGNS